MELVNQKIEHNKYGEGTILNYSPNPIELDTKFSIYFEGLGEKQFSFKQMDRFFKLPDELLDTHNKLYKATQLEKEAHIKSISKGIAANKASKNHTLQLEYDDSLTEETIMDVLPTLNDYRFVFEHRPIVVDKKKCYINALYALNDLQMDLALSELTYNTCSKNKNKGAEFCGHHFKFATIDELELILEELRSNGIK